MLSRDDLVQMTLLYAAHNFNVLYESISYFIPAEEQVIVASSSTQFDDVTYMFYMVKFLHYVYLSYLVKACDVSYDTVMIKYRDANSKIYKNTTFPDILDTTNPRLIGKKYLQKPCLGVIVSTNTASVSLPTDIFRNQVIDNNVMDIVSFHVKQYHQDWTKLEIKYIGKTITISHDKLYTSTVENILKWRLLKTVFVENCLCWKTVFVKKTV